MANMNDDMINRLLEMDVNPDGFMLGFDAKGDFYEWLCAQGVARRLGMIEMGDWTEADVHEAVRSAQVNWPLSVAEVAAA